MEGFELYCDYGVISKIFIIIHFSNKSIQVYYSVNSKIYG